MLVDDRAEFEVVERILFRQLVRRSLDESEVTGRYADRIKDCNEDALVVFRTLRDKIQGSFEIV